MRTRVPILLALVLLPAVAWADPRDDARRHFRAALDAAAQEDYQGAVDEFLAAYAAIPHPVTAFNIATSYADLGQLEDAVFWYRKVIDLDPSREAEVTPVIVDLQKQIQAAAAPAPVVVEPTPLIVEDEDAVRARLEALEAERRALREQLGLPPVEVAAPADTGVTEEPVDTDVVEEPVDTDVVEEPVDTDVVEEPVDTDAVEEPVDTDAVEEPVDTDAVEEPEPPAERPSSELQGLSNFDPYEEVVVTASRYGQEPLDSPQSVTVLTGEDIRMSGAVHIADALRRVVGVDVMSMSAGVPWLGIRNFNTELNNKVLWLVDGRPAMVPYLGTALPMSLGVTLEEIERVEVIRGPGSAIYGANAFTGVVNIITRQPGSGTPFEAVAQYGNNNYARASAVASGSVGRAAYRFSAGFQQENRFELERLDLASNPTIDPFREDAIGDRRVHLGGRVDTTFADKGLVSLAGNWDSGVAEYYSKPALGNQGIDAQFGVVRGDISYGPFHARLYYQREDGRSRRWLRSTGATRSPEDRLRNDLVNAQIEGDFRVMTGPVEHRFFLGGTYEFRQYRAGPVGAGFEIPRRENHGAGFATYTLNYKAIQANLSLRVDKHALLEASDTISPRGALVFRVAPNTALRMSGGSAFRAMNGLESYVNVPLDTSDDGYFVQFFGAATDPRGQNLGPERIVNAELGLRDESSPIHSLDVVAYWNQVTDVIDVGEVETVLDGFQDGSAGFPFGRSSWVNTGTVYNAVGGEIDLTLFPADGLDIYANVAITRVFGANPETEETFVDDSNGLVKANIGVQYRSPWRFDLSVHTHFTSGQTWRVSSLDATGNTQVELLPIPARVLMVTRLVGHVIEKPGIDLGITLWNPVGFAGGFYEHPNGQRVGPRVYGTVGVKF